MTARRNRLAVAARHAEEVEQEARARWAAANRLVLEAERERDVVLERAGVLAREDVTNGLRGHLASVGARHLLALTDKKATLAVEATALQGDYDAARARLRSLERVVERLDDAERLRRRRHEEAELRDLIAARTYRRTP